MQGGIEAVWGAVGGASEGSGTFLRDRRPGRSSGGVMQENQQGN